MKSRTILVVDDDPKMRRLLRRCFEADGYSVIEADTEADVLSSISGGETDLVTLDIGLGRENGLTIARDIRKQSNVPIMMITAKDDVIDRVVGLEIGADDYITKPFHVREVVARAQALLRRAHGKGSVNGERKSEASDFPADEFVYLLDDMVFDPGALELEDRTGARTDLTTAEIRLLTVFLERPKRALSRDQIMTLMNGNTWTPLDRTIDNQVARLRKKIERDPGHPKLIKTVRGIGYILTADVRKRPL